MRFTPRRVQSSFSSPCTHLQPDDYSDFERWSAKTKPICPIHTQISLTIGILGSRICVLCQKEAQKRWESQNSAETGEIEQIKPPAEQKIVIIPVKTRNGMKLKFQTR